MTDRTFSMPALYAWRLKTVGSPLVNIDFFFSLQESSFLCSHGHCN